jgi:hypothetical protein
MTNTPHPILWYFHHKLTQTTVKDNLQPIINLIIMLQPTTLAFAGFTNNFPSPVPQITYPMPYKTPQNKSEPNPALPPPLQIRELPQQSDKFPTHGTILTILGGSNTTSDKSIMWPSKVLSPKPNGPTYQSHSQSKSTT